MKTTKVIVPATSANLGPGFDALGLALNLYNEVTAIKSDTFSIEIENNISGIPTTDENLIYKSISYFYEKVSIPVPTLKLIQKDSIPVGCGLGSSAACIVAGLYLAREISGVNVSNESLLKMAYDIEGHGDNVAAAIYGGMVACSAEKDDVYISKTNVTNDISFALLVPNFTLSTSEARAVLPLSYTKEDVVFNISNVALFVSSIINGHWHNLKKATQDAIHTPYRSKLISNIQQIFEMCYKNKAIGVFISGAGPTIISIILKDDEISFKKSIEEDIKVFKDWQVKLLKANNKGAEIILNTGS